MLDDDDFGVHIYVTDNGKVKIQVEDLHQVREYILENSRFHNVESRLHHSWPCSVWDDRFNEDLGYDTVFSHGCVPKNYILT